MKIFFALLSLEILFVLSACNSFPPFSHSSTATAVLDTETLHSGWSVIYQQELGEYYWGVGTHYYQFTSDCPDVEFLGDLEGKLIHFTVNKDNLTYLFSENVVDLSYDTVGVDYDGYNVLASIRPEQKTRFRFGYKDLTLDQARYAADKCQVNVTVDKLKSISLKSLVQLTEFWHRGYYHR